MERPGRFKVAYLTAVARASGTQIVLGIGRKGVPASTRVEEKHGAVQVDRACCIGALELAAADGIRRCRKLDFVAISEADPAFVERVRHGVTPHNLVTDLVGAKRLLIFAHA